MKNSGKKRTLFLSHRGESDDALENTLAAFALAMARDSDGIELDLRMTKDGQIICFHDATLQRIAGVDIAVSENTLADLQTACPDIPLFSEIIGVFQNGKHLQIELKGSPAQLPQVHEILASAPQARQCFSISSFEPETIREAAVFFPDLPRVLLTDLRTLQADFPPADAVMRMLSPLRCGISFKGDFAADYNFVQALHQHHIRVVCWGITSDELGLSMAAAGVDALTCNHAVKLREKFLAANP